MPLLSWLVVVSVTVVAIGFFDFHTLPTTITTTTFAEAVIFGTAPKKVTHAWAALARTHKNYV